MGSFTRSASCVCLAAGGLLLHVRPMGAKPNRAELRLTHRPLPVSAMQTPRLPSLRKLN